MEDYKKKYEEALERMKSWARGEHPECFTEAQKTAEFIFPELAEVDGEWIRKNLINVFKDEYGTNTYFVGMKVKDIIAWLEKQGGQKKPNKNIVEIWKNMRLEVYQQASGNRHEPNCSDDTTKMFSLNDIDEIIEKVGEQTLVDTVEPKFKVGDWITHNTANFVFQVVSFGPCGYEVINRDNYTKIISLYNEDNYHPWTIEDAQDGDVLAITMYPEGTWVGIFKEHTAGFHTFSSYCFVNTEGIFKLGIYHDGKGMHPATKEQRDLLFQKMKESGYKWENNQLEEINNKGLVDLGLPSGTLWATCNLGAEKETDFGLFYQWGDTEGYNPDEGHDFNWDNYKWGAFGNFTKYNNSDGKLVLDNDDDPVFVATNGMFKIPTKEQLQELIEHTNHEWIENFKESGVKGMKFTNKKDDTKYIFIPAAGFCGNGGHNDAGSWGCVWSAYCNEYGVDYAWNINFSVDYVGMDYFHRCDGFSVRGVLNK